MSFSFPREYIPVCFLRLSHQFNKSLFLRGMIPLGFWPAFPSIQQIIVLEGAIFPGLFPSDQTICQNSGKSSSPQICKYSLLVGIYSHQKQEQLHLMGIPFPPRWSNNDFDRKEKLKMPPQDHEFLCLGGISPHASGQVIKIHFKNRGYSQVIKFSSKQGRDTGNFIS